MRIAVADDAVLLREGLVRLLTESGHEVVAVVGDGPSLVTAVVTHRPEVSIVDVQMPPSHTVEGLREAVEARRLVPGRWRQRSALCPVRSAKSDPEGSLVVTLGRQVLRSQQLDPGRFGMG